MGFWSDLFLGTQEGREHRREMKELRNEKDIARYDNKWSAYTTAYQHGIDPRAAVWGGLSSMTQSLGQAASNIWGGSKQPISGNTDISPANQNIVMYAIIAVIIIIFMNK